MLDTGRAGESDVAGAQLPVPVAGRVPTGLCRGQEQPRGSHSSSAEESDPAWSLSHFMIVSLTGWFTLTVTCLTFRGLPRSGLNFLINNQTDKNHWKR